MVSEIVTGAERIDRRRFLGLSAGALFTGITIAAGCNENPPFSLSRLKDYRLLPSLNPLPRELTGISFNSPFLWREIGNNTAVDQAITHARKFGASSLRVFINDDFEPEIGRYDFSVLEKIAKLADKFPLQVDLFDAYTLLHADKFNPTYGSHPLTSPYLESPFFTDALGTFRKRVQAIIERLKDHPGIISLSVANELEVPKGTSQDPKFLLTQWYMQVLEQIKDCGWEKPILSGLANPNFVDGKTLEKAGLTANTIHLYPDLTNPGNKKMKDYFTENPSLPLICQEIGFPQKLFGLNLSLPLYDKLLSLFIEHCIVDSLDIDHFNKTAKPKMPIMIPWQIDFEANKNRDGFTLNPENLPLTLNSLLSFKDLVSKSISLCG